MAVLKVDLLPKKIRAEFDRKLIEQGFGGYQILSDWLAEQGHPVSKDAIGDYSKNLKAQTSKLRVIHNFATAYGYELPDDEGTVAKMLTGLVQVASYRALVQIVSESESLDADSDMNGFLRRLETVSRILGGVSRSDVATLTIAKHAADIRAKQEAALDKLKAEGKKRGIDDVFLDKMDAFLGLVDSKNDSDDTQAD
jgi:Protein of unknown function (DUF3486)